MHVYERYGGQKMSITISGSMTSSTTRRRNTNNINNDIIER
jgi:hypothetical protein